MGKLRNSLMEIINAQNNSLNYMQEQHERLKLEKRMQCEDIDRLLDGNKFLLALNNDLSQKISLLEEENNVLQQRINVRDHVLAFLNKPAI